MATQELGVTGQAIGPEHSSEGAITVAPAPARCSAAAALCDRAPLT
ncbi:MAG TPA: hypothetical protein VH012_04490 [Acidimicrobiales bacterium]|nr:hypothetical protein [Acidimicrobiales bacterium]